MVEKAAQSIIPNITPVGVFEVHESAISAVIVFPDGRHMVTGSFDKLRLWDLNNRSVLNKMEGHRGAVRAVAVTRNGHLMASGDETGEFIAWDGKTGGSLTLAIEAHSDVIRSLDFSPDGAVLATGSEDQTTKLWKTKTWTLQGNPIYCHARVNCVRYSPSGEHLAIATFGDIQIWNPASRDCIANLQVHASMSLAWTPSGKLLSGSNWDDPTIREWDPSTSWTQVGDPWEGHTQSINTIVVDSSGNFVASASDDKHVRLWRLSDRQTIAILEHSGWVSCLTFSTDSKNILSGGQDKMISEWAVLRGSLNLPFAKIRAIDQIALNEALLNAQTVIDRNPSSYRGYELKHAALHDAQRYDEAIAAFETMLFKLDNAFDTQIPKLREHYLSPSEAEGAIRAVIHAQLDNTPLRVFDTITGLFCDREAQISVFKTSTEYKELLLYTMNHAELPSEGLKEMVEMYFGCVMLSHRWEGKEPLLHDVQDKVVYKLDAVGGILKLQSFCKIAREAGYRWAWSDTCCIDKNDNLELQQSLNSMFVWYRHSALTIVYLADVRPSSKYGALSKSEWIRRGWTVGEFLAPKVVRFYQKDWTPYLDDHSPNHKESVVIMRELVCSTGIDPSALVTFHPGMRGAREKLQWASTRVTTLQEDIAYSLFGIFGVHLPAIYDEKKHNALGRLLQEIVARSGDITALDWVGKPSEFNTCLPADITSYKAPPSMLPSLSEDEMQDSVSFLRNSVTVELALEFYTLFDKQSAPRFANCRLHLPCIAFRVTAVRGRRGQGQETSFTYTLKADGLNDLLITTEDRPSQFSRAMDTKQTLLLVRPWSRYLLGQPESANDVQSVADWSMAGSSLYNFPGGSRSRAARLFPRLGQPFGSFFDALRGGKAVNSESHSQALQLIVRLGQPFSALLLAQQPGGEYKRIASDCNIIAQVTDMASVRSMMDVRTLEIL